MDDDATTASTASTRTPGLSDDEVRHVAKLARLAVPDTQIHAYSEQLTGILGYVAKIGEVDVSGVEPTAHAVTLTNVLREDAVGEHLTNDEVLQNAPDSDPPFFKVPKILGGDEDSAG